MDNPESLNENEIVAEYKRLFINAVTIRNTEADKTALSVSGGYDSCDYIMIY